MTVTSVITDPDALTITLVADFPVPVERLWDAFADPRKLERFWGPPGYPATFDDFELRTGNTARYWMTSPQGEKYFAVWEFTDVVPGRSISLIDHFADADSQIDPAMPVTSMTSSFDETATGSRLTSVSRFDTADDLQKILAMGVVEGLTRATAQLDIVLADLRQYSLGTGTHTEIMDDTHVRITRAFDAPRHLIWQAHTDPELMKRWLLGPGGWIMTVCEIDTAPGGSYRNAWAPEEGGPGQPFGFEGETLVYEPERRMVSTERMTGADFPGTVNDLSFAEADGVTLLTLVITYADLSQRDMILATGMTDGMESSYARLESELVSQ